MKNNEVTCLKFPTMKISTILGRWPDDMYEAYIGQ